MRDSIAAAYNLAVAAHKGQKYGSNDYFEQHILKVWDKCWELFYNSAGVQIVCLLHDILEDTSVTEEQLRQEFSDEVVNAVVAITKKEGESYDKYLFRVKINPSAKQVKIADILCNMEQCLMDNDILRAKMYADRLAKIL